MRRCIFLTGSPDAASLDWSSKLLSDFQSPVQRHLSGNHPSVSALQPDASLTPSKWRVLSIEPNKRDTTELPETRFQPPSQGSSAAGTDRAGFLEYSLALIEGLDPSQVGTSVEDATTANASTFLSTASITTSIDSTALQSLASSPAASNTDNPISIQFSGIITDLRSIPTAQHLLSIQPQTQTTNLIAAVIAVSPTRTVQLRKSNSEMDIIEVTIGDETRAGFAISFWVVPEESQHKPKDDMRAALSRLRSGDVVLLQNVALSEFRGNVYGQSLSKRFARNSTSIAVFDREKGVDQVVRQASWHFKNKSKRVQAWADAFVGVPWTKKVGDGGHLVAEDGLPPDTQ